MMLDQELSLRLMDGRPMVIESHNMLESLNEEVNLRKVGSWYLETSRHINAISITHSWSGTILKEAIARINVISISFIN